MNAKSNPITSNEATENGFRPRRSRSKRVVVGLLLLSAITAAIVAAFRRRGAPDALFLYSGAGLRPAMHDIIAEYENKTGIPVEATYAGSGCLLSMLSFARSGDLYLPGERYYAEQAAAKGFVRVDRTVAYFTPVVMVRKGNPKNIRSLRDLTRPDVRVGIGQPDVVAAGRLAKEILEKAAVWDEVKANIDARGAQTATAVELSNAVVLNALDAAINWDAMAWLVRDRVDVLQLPPQYSRTIEIPLAVLTFSKHRRAAARFLDFVSSDVARRIFRKHGYRTSPTPDSFAYRNAPVLAP